MSDAISAQDTVKDLEQDPEQYSEQCSDQEVTTGVAPASAVPAEAEAESKSDSEAEARSRADLYALLSSIFLREPTRKFIDELASPEITRALRSCGVKIDLEAMTDDDIERLGYEYVYLFLGPGPHFPPFESVQRGSNDVKGNRQLGQMMGKFAIEVDEEYERHGLELSRELKNQPDHIAAELAFMSHLCRKEADACSSTKDQQPERPARSERPDHTDSISAIRRDQKTFLELHLSCWAPQYLEVIFKAAKSAYFTEFAAFTAAFIRSDTEELPRVSSA